MWTTWHLPDIHSSIICSSTFQSKINKLLLPTTTGIISQTILSESRQTQKNTKRTMTFIWSPKPGKVVIYDPRGQDSGLHLSPLSGPPLSPTSFSLETQPLEIDPEDQLFKTHCWLICLLSVMVFIIIIILSIIFIPSITKTTIIILYNLNPLYICQALW